MAQPAAAATQAGTVWKRAAALFVVCMVAVGVLALGLIVGVIPVSFGVSGNPIKLTIASLEGTKMTAYVGTDPSVESGQKAGAIAALEGGEIRSMCMSTVLDLPIIGDLSIHILSGESKPIPFSELSAHADKMIIGKVKVKDVDLGISGSDLSANNLIQGPNGSWGLQLDNTTVTDIKASGDEAKVGQLRLRGLGLKIKFGEHNCY